MPRSTALLTIPTALIIQEHYLTYLRHASPRLFKLFTSINQSPPSQVASRTWEELNAEAKKTVSTGQINDSGAEGNSSDADLNNSGSSGTLPSGGDGLEWLELWGVDRSSLPQWFTSWQANDNAVRNKIRNVVRQEWTCMGEREEAVKGGVGGHMEGRQISELPPPGPPLLDKSGRFFDMGAYVTESTVFPFVLIESFWKYSDPKLVVAGAAEDSSSRE